jgi:hypothetical protein
MLYHIVAFASYIGYEEDCILVRQQEECGVTTKLRASHLPMLIYLESSQLAALKEFSHVTPPSQRRERRRIMSEVLILARLATRIGLSSRVGLENEWLLTPSRGMDELFVNDARSGCKEPLRHGTPHKKK